MREPSAFSWLSAAGWLILSGRADALGEIRALALSRCDANGDLAYISLNGDQGDALMEDMAELGAGSGYLVDLDEADNNEIYERLSEAAMIVVEADCAGEGLLRALKSTAAHAMKAALERGSLVLLEGAAAAAAGAQVLDPAGATKSGLGFVKRALVLADSPGMIDQAELRALRSRMPEVTFISLPAGAALALGPDGRMETWGEAQVSVSLGSLALAQPESANAWALE